LGRDPRAAEQLISILFGRLLLSLLGLKIRYLDREAEAPIGEMTSPLQLLIFNLGAGRQWELDGYAPIVVRVSHS
jgi:hypothetical protein